MCAGSIKEDRYMLKIRRADPEGYESVRDFYYSLIDAMEQMQYKPRWEKDVRV